MRVYKYYVAIYWQSIWFSPKKTAIFRLSGWKKNIIFIEFFQTKNLITDSIKFTFEFGESNLMMATPSLTS